LDFAVGRLPDGLQSEVLAFSPMETEPIALIARYGHPLLRKPDPLKPMQLLEFDWVMPGPDNLLTRTVLARLQLLGLPRPTQRVFTASFLLTLALLQQSDAIAAVSLASARQFASGAAAGFELLPIDLAIAVEPYGMITRARVSLPPTSQRLCDLIRQAVPG
ncbi:MAG: LysR substrate-binding domain-containing protein, partial [Paracoccaceae bacterium]